jgi:hypothetical protein
VPDGQCADPIDAALLPLVLDEGQPARAEGTLVTIRGGLRLIADGGAIIGSGAAIAAATMSVPLRDSGFGVDVNDLEWRHLSVAGVLRDGHLVISSADAITVPPSPDAEVATWWAPTEPISLGSDRSRNFALRLPAENALMEEGVLLDAWTDDQTGRRIALATDVEKVQASLFGHYGASLNVVTSRWRREFLDEIRMSVDEQLVHSSGTAIGHDMQMQVALTLLHLPSRVARRLSRFPPEALAVTVLVRPGM